MDYGMFLSVVRHEDYRQQFPILDPPEFKSTVSRVGKPKIYEGDSPDRAEYILFADFPSLLEPVTFGIRHHRNGDSGHYVGSHTCASCPDSACEHLRVLCTMLQSDNLFIYPNAPNELIDRLPARFARSSPQPSSQPEAPAAKALETPEMPALERSPEGREWESVLDKLRKRRATATTASKANTRLVLAVCPPAPGKSGGPGSRLRVDVMIEDLSESKRRQRLSKIPDSGSPLLSDIDSRLGADVGYIASLANDPRRRVPELAGAEVTTAVMEQACIRLMTALPIVWDFGRQTLPAAVEWEITPTWKPEAGGGQRLQFLGPYGPLSVAERDMETCAVYLDDAKNEVGIARIDPITLRSLRAMPLLEARFADEVGALVSGLPSLWSIPVPRSSVEAIDLRPDVQGHVKLAPGPFNTLQAELIYRYGDHDFGAGGTPVGFKLFRLKGRIHRLHRQPDAEAEIRARFLAASFFDDNGTFRYSQVGREKRTLDKLLCEALPKLQARGLSFEIDEAFHLRVADASAGLITQVDQADGSPWLEVGVGIEVDGTHVELLPVLRDAIRTGLIDQEGRITGSMTTLYVPAADGVLVPLDVTRLTTMIRPIFDLLSADNPKSPSRLRIRKAAYGSIDHMNEAAGAEVRASVNASKVIERVRNRTQTELVVPDTFIGTLLPFQVDGVRWLSLLADLGLGAMLADDMGLGKTVQAIAHLLIEKSRGQLKGPVLVVCPMSLFDNWKQEFQKFAPSLRVCLWHGPNRGDPASMLKGHDVLITSYGTMAKSVDLLRKVFFDLAIFDETKNFKNASTDNFKAASQLTFERGIALGGTMIENNLLELWSISDLVNPMLLGDRVTFTKMFRTPIEKGDNPDAAERLRRRMSLVSLRREKKDVLTQLPEKLVAVQRLDFAREQRDVYEAARAVVSGEVATLMREKGGSASQTVLTKLLRLRQICCAPVILTHDWSVAPSAKEEWIQTVVPQMIAEGRRILIFSEFAMVIDVLQARLRDVGTVSECYSGENPKTRNRAIERFRSGEISVLGLTTKSGGVGLNIPEADTVIHYEPNWNPSNEDQATDRAHRVVSTHPHLFIYKLVAVGTLEERIVQMQERKRQLAKGFYGGGSTDQMGITAEDIAALLAPLPEAA